MEDISKNNNPTQNPFQSAQSTPPVQPATPSVQPVTPTQTDQAGAEYEKNELAPEDLDARWTRWQCGVCNYTYEGSKPLKKCPRCGNEDPDKFLDAD